MGSNILILDDEKKVLSLLNNILVKNGYRCFLANNTKEARNTLNNTKIDLILCDISMPDESGTDFLENMKEKLGDTAVIIVTGVDSPEEAERAIESGIYGYILKPFQRNQILISVANALRRQELEKKEREFKETLKNEVKKQTVNLENTIELLKSSEKLLSESEEKFRAISETAKDAIIMIDYAGRIIYWNKSAEKIFGYARDEVLFKELHKLIVPDYYYSDFAKAFKNFQQNGLAKSYHKQVHLRALHKNSKEFPVSLSLAGIKIQDKWNAAGIVRDISEEKYLEENLALEKKRFQELSKDLEEKNMELEKAYSEIRESQAREIQQEKMASIGQLAAGVAHEINNPTGFVSSNLKTFKDYQDDILNILEKYNELSTELSSETTRDIIPPQIIKKVDIIEKQKEKIDFEYIMEDIRDLINESEDGVERIKNMVKDLKDFAHPGASNPSYVNINDNINSTLNIVWNEIKYKAEVEKDYGELPDVFCYPQQINQVFMNILVNAAQAIESNGMITISTRAEENSVLVRISDNGTGIPDEIVSKIYDPFFTTKEVGKGTGLGLNMVYNIIKKHKGSIDVESRLGEGTTFNISIPVDGIEEE